MFLQDRNKRNLNFLVLALLTVVACVNACISDTAISATGLGGALDSGHRGLPGVSEKTPHLLPSLHPILHPPGSALTLLPLPGTFFP